MRLLRWRGLLILLRVLGVGLLMMLRMLILKRGRLLVVTLGMMVMLALVLRLLWNLLLVVMLLLAARVPRRLLFWSVPRPPQLWTSLMLRVQLLWWRGGSASVPMREVCPLKTRGRAKLLTRGRGRQVGGGLVLGGGCLVGRPAELSLSRRRSSWRKLRGFLCWNRPCLWRSCWQSVRGSGPVRGEARSLAPLSLRMRGCT